MPALDVALRELRMDALVLSARCGARRNCVTAPPSCDDIDTGVAGRRSSPLPLEDGGCGAWPLLPRGVIVRFAPLDDVVDLGW